MAFNRDHLEQTLELALLAPGAGSAVMNHRGFFPADTLKAEKMQGTGRHTPAASRAAYAVNLGQKIAASSGRGCDFAISTWCQCEYLQK